MSSEINGEWVDDLVEEIEDLMNDYKCAKFNTHKNRKLFFGQIKSLIHEAYRKETQPPEQNPRRRSWHVTRLQR